MERTRVVFVPDGDTLRLEDGSWVRLIGIDAPEVRQKDKKGSCAGDLSRRALLDLVGKKYVRIHSHGKDRYGRVLARVYLENGLLVNEEMLRRGMAWVLIHGKPDPWISAWMDLQKGAIAGRRGIWPQVSQQVFAVVGNRRSYRFHRVDCHYAHKIRTRNRIYFSSPHQAFLAGYAPARECLPDPVCH